MIPVKQPLRGTPAFAQMRIIKQQTLLYFKVYVKTTSLDLCMGFCLFPLLFVFFFPEQWPTVTVALELTAIRKKSLSSEYVSPGHK